jgi:hypothetical protein
MFKQPINIPGKLERCVYPSQASSHADAIERDVRRRSVSRF